MRRVRGASSANPVEVTGFAITLRRGGFDAHLSAVAIERIRALRASLRTVEQIAAEIHEPEWVVAVAVRWTDWISRASPPS